MVGGQVFWTMPWPGAGKLRGIMRRVGTPAEAAIVRAARAQIIKSGMKNTTMTAIARDAGVSRPTLYSHFANLGALTTTMLTRELVEILHVVHQHPKNLDDLVRIIVICTDLARGNELVRAIVEHDSAILNTYLFERLGSGQVEIIDHLSRMIQKVQEKDPTMRQDNAHPIAVMVLALAQTAALSSPEMAAAMGTGEAWQSEFAHIIKGLLLPKS